MTFVCESHHSGKIYGLSVSFRLGSYPKSYIGKIGDEALLLMVASIDTC